MADYDDWEDMLDVSSEEISHKLQPKPTNKYDNEEQPQEEVKPIAPTAPVKKNKILKDKLKIKEEKPVQKDEWDDVLEMNEPLPYNRDEYVPQKHETATESEKDKENQIVNEKTKGKRKILNLFVQSDMGISKMKKSMNYKNGDYEDALYKHLASWFKHIKELNDGINYKDEKFKQLPLPFTYEQLPDFELKTAWMNIANKDGKSMLYEKVLTEVFGNEIRRDFVLIDKRGDISNKKSGKDSLNGMENESDKSTWVLIAKTK